MFTGKPIFSSISRFINAKKMNFAFAAVLGLSLSFSACLFDSVETIDQEVPYTISMTMSGTETNAEQSQTFNLDENDLYENNRDKINKIEFVKIAYKTKSVTPSNVTGNITLTVKQKNGTTLFSQSIPGASPAAYLTNAFELTISQAEIQALNAYLANLSNRELTVMVKIQNATAGAKTLAAEIFFVLKIQYES